jgi:glyoxylase-like metal-dependent hydrolase (beta-lactamase superfamily II)
MIRLLAASAFAAITTIAAAQDAPPPIEAVQVAPGVHVLYGQGGNIGVSTGGDGMFLIDDQYANLTDQVVAALARISAGQPRFVLNTHWHHDHTGGNENLAARGSVIVAHDRVRERMSVENVNEFLKRTTPPSPAGALPVVTFNDSLSLHVNGDELRGIHVRAAHTDGDVFIHFRKANVIHTGDLVFAGMYPFIDLDSGGSVAGVIAAVDRMLALANEGTRVIPGHGKVTDRAGLEAYRQLLVVTSADYDGQLAWAFITAERFIQILYRDAVRELSASRT